jgi:drug/metabolite transporter (DMT)-like permease
MNRLGELAAIGTSLCWSCGSIFFTVASRRIGSNTVNRLRIALALLFLIITHLIIFGQPLPLFATRAQWFWFALSGLIGFAIGDTLLFRSFVLVGPRISMLMMALAPVMGTVIAWIFLNETLTAAKLAAIIVTLSGISLVITEPGKEGSAGKKHWAGIWTGLGAAAGQAIGLIASKKGLGAGFSPVSGNLIRLLSATIALWIASAAFGKIPVTIQRSRDRRAMLGVLGGAVMGPFLGVGLSLIAIQHAFIGIASTLMALPPVFLIPLSRWFFKEKITLRAVVGTFIALAGVALLFLI